MILTWSLAMSLTSTELVLAVMVWDFYGDFGNSYTIPQTYTSTLGTHITFPDCWDGQPFTLQTKAEQANCPEGYSRIPGLMLSVCLYFFQCQFRESIFIY